MLGIGSYAFRWAGGIGDRIPPEPITPIQVLDRAADLGIGLLQFADNIPLHRQSPEAITALAARASTLGIQIELGMTGCDPALVGTYLDLAGKLNASLLRIAPSAEESARSDKEVAALFRDILPAANAAKVTLAVENHFHLPSPRLVSIIEDVADANLGVCLDVANSIACEEWPTETIALLAPYAVNLHLKDFRITLDPHGVGCAIVGMPLGQGLTDIGAVYDALAKHGRTEINTILEHWLPWQGSLAPTLEQELTWLEQSVAAARAHQL